MATTSNYQIYVKAILNKSDLQKQLGELSKEINKTFSTSSSTNKSFYNLLTTFNNVKSAVIGVATAFRDLTEPVFELDSALTEFSKVSDLSGDALEQYTEKAAALGETVARTTSEMVDAATQFRKNNFNDEDSLALGQIAALYQNVADESLSAGDAASFIISQMKAFNITADDAISIIDRVNEVSNNFAVSSSDISAALTKTSSAMSAYGNSIDETIALVTSGTEIMTGQASKVARGLRTIGANITNFATDSGQIEYSVQGVKTYLGLLDESTGDLKNTYRVMEELSKSWTKMTNAEKSNLAIKIAGKNQLEVFTSVMNNFKDAQKALTASTESNGSAIQENAKYMEHLEAKVSALKAAWENLINSLISSDVVKTLIEDATSFINLLNSDVGESILQFIALTATLLTVEKGILSIATAVKTLGSVISTTNYGVVGLGLTLASAVIVWGKNMREAQEEATNFEGKIADVGNEITDLTNKIKELQAQGASSEVTEAYERQLELLKNTQREYANAQIAKLTSGVPKQDYNWETQQFESTGEMGASTVENAISRYNQLSVSLENLNTKTSDFTDRYEDLTEQVKEQVDVLIGYKDSITNAIKAGAELDESQKQQYYTLSKLVGGVDGLNTAYNVVTESEIKNSNAAQAYISSLDNLKGVANNTGQSLESLAISSINLDNTKLSFDEQIASLGIFQQTLDQTTGSALILAKAIQDLSDFSNELSPAEALERVQHNLQTGFYYDLLNLGNLKSDIDTSVTESGGGVGGSSKTTDPIKEQSDAFKEQIDILEHRFEILKRNGATEQEQIEAYKNIQNTIHQQAEWFRSQGLDDNSEYIRNLQEQWWKYADSIDEINKEMLEKQKEYAQKVVDAYETYASHMAKTLREQRDSISDEYDKRIEALQEERDALSDINDETEKQLQLQKLQDALAAAKAKRVKVYQKGQGFVYQQDTSAVSTAQSNLESYQRQLALEEQRRALDEKIALLEKEKKTTISNLDKQIDAWEDFVSEYKENQDLIEAYQYLGTKNEKSILDTRLSNFQQFVKEYKDAADKYREITDNIFNQGDNNNSGGDNNNSGGDNNASGTTYYSGGLTHINENGSEMVIPPSLNTLANLPTGTGIIPHTLTNNLMEIGKYTLKDLKRMFMGDGGTSYSFSNATFAFPNMTNSSSIEQFMKDLSNFENIAIQSGYSRR